jgi:hypothetical protein
MSVTSTPRLYRIPVNCLAGDVVGDFVYITGDKVGTRHQVAKADPSDAGMMPAVGVLIQKLDATTGVVQVREKTSLYSGLTSGEIYVVGTDARPATSGDGNYPVLSDIVQQIGIAVDDTELLVQPMAPGVPYLGAAEVGQVLYSRDGINFAAETPLTSDAGWLVNEDGILLITG